MHTGRRTPWVPAYVGIGSNLDDPPAQVWRGLDALRGLPATHLVLVSPLYWNPPMGETAQPDYVNAVAALLTTLGPHELLEALLSVERASGRDRSGAGRWGPRILDLDLLVYGRARLAEPGLTLPHPGIAARNFVLFPLNDIAPDLDIPGLGRVAGLLAGVPSEGLRRHV